MADGTAGGLLRAELHEDRAVWNPTGGPSLVLVVGADDFFVGRPRGRFKGADFKEWRGGSGRGDPGEVVKVPLPKSRVIGDNAELPAGREDAMALAEKLVLHDTVFVVLGLGPRVGVVEVNDTEDAGGAAPAEELGGVTAHHLHILQAGAADAVGGIEVKLVGMLHGEEVGRRVTGGSLKKKCALAAADFELDRSGWLREKGSQVKITGSRTVEDVVRQGRESVAADFDVAGVKVTFFRKA